MMKDGREEGISTRTQKPNRTEPNQTEIYRLLSIEEKVGWLRVRLYRTKAVLRLSADPDCTACFGEDV